MLRYIRGKAETANRSPVQACSEAVATWFQSVGWEGRVGGGEGRVGECHGVNALFSPLAWKLTFSIKSIAHRRGALFSRRPPICIRFPFSLLLKKIQAGYQSNSDPRNFHVLHSHCAFPCQSNCGTAGCGQDTRASIIVHVGVCVMWLDCTYSD